MTELVSRQILIPLELNGQRADAALAHLFPEYSRTQLTQWLKEQLITINGLHLKPKDKVIGGELVILEVPMTMKDAKAEPEDIPLDIVFEDEHLLVINKSAGLVVHPGAGNPSHTLVNALLHHDERLNILPRAGVIHRLDKETTGLLIVAKTMPVYTVLVRMMQNREINRQYMALVYGHVIAGGRIETNFGRHAKNRLKMAVKAIGKEAITEYSVKKHYQDFTLLDVKLMTGRTHQIRVHMAHILHPIVGDPLYGGRLKLPKNAPEDLRKCLQQFERQALHAYYLSFKHPVLEKLLTYEVPLPDDFGQLISILDEYNEPN